MKTVHKPVNRVDYNRIAPFYNFLQGLIFGQRLLTAQTHFFHEIHEGARVLVVGGGSGSCLDPLLKRQPDSILYLDSSKKMLDLAQKRFINHQHIQWLQHDILSYETDQTFDFILLPFILDHFGDDELSELLPRFNELLKLKGKIVFTDFYYSKSTMRNKLIAVMILFFKFTVHLKLSSLPNFDKAWITNRFKLEKEASFLGGMVKTQILSAI